jgi:hypothetical protein
MGRQTANRTQNTMKTQNITKYRVTKAGDPSLWIGHVFSSGNGWIFRSMTQVGSSRREWPTPEAALKGRVRNYELVAITGGCK